MLRGNRLEQVVWDEFADDPRRLRKTAALIAAGYQSVIEPAAPQDEEEEFPEGRIVYRLHRARERSHELVRTKKAQARKLSGSLRCEVCAFDFELRYGELGKDFIECHHTVPVSDMAPGAVTKIKDVVLVCSNCHRMLHRKRPWLRVEDVRTLLA
jgi:5-methylcytosine-specific restriction protein A